MRNSKNISRIVPRAIFLMLLLIWCVALCSDVFAIPADKGDFIVLGRQENEELVDEKVTLSVEPGVTTQTQARLQSGTEMLVLDLIEVEGEIYYIVSTVGREGGIIGWISEEYIYEVIQQE
ncbi:hypothetical protein KJ909_04040 [Patescibacteria group bacterium]|nr:hypothetical protein [Patescibacteria group bacterium]